MDLETERLRLRRLRVSDAPDLFRTVGDPAVMRHWAPGPDDSIAAAAHRIIQINAHWRTHGFGDWGVIEKASGQLIGLSGLHVLPGIAEVNIGYAFEKARWRQGFAYETCRAILDHGFRTLGLEQIVAVIAPENSGSARLAEKCGVPFWKAFTWSGHQRLAYRAHRSDALAAAEPAHPPPARVSASMRSQKSDLASA